MKNFALILAFLTGLIGSQTVFADFKQIGRAIQDRKTGDKIYLACTSENPNECTHLTMILESVSYEAGTTHYFDLTNGETSINQNRIQSQMKKYVDAKLQLPTGPEDFAMFTLATLYLAIAGDAPLLAIATPVAVAGDIVAAPIRAVSMVAKNISEKVVLNKIESALKINLDGANLRPKKLKHKYFSKFVSAVTR